MKTKIIILSILNILLTATNANSFQVHDVNDEVELTNCSLKGITSENEIPITFSVSAIYSEAGELKKYIGKVCKHSWQVEMIVQDKMVQRVSIIDPQYCNDYACIGDTFEKVSKNLPYVKKYIGGEDGGFLSLEGKDGFSYAFSTNGIPISCFLNIEKCKCQFDNATLTSVVL